MILDCILGNNIDTEIWINMLKNEYSDHIVVVDYDYYGESYIEEKVTYISSKECKDYVQRFDSVCFYKSLYGYPGMSKRMSELFKK